VKKNTDSLILLNAIFVASLIIANIVAGKVIQIGVFVVPSAVVAYAFTFLSTDIIGELWGKEEANKAVKRGFYIQIWALILISLAIVLKPAPFAVDYAKQFKTVLGQGARTVTASLIAYLFSQANDVFIFHKLKEKHKGKYKWLRNNVSTMTSQIIDTAIFITIAFYGVVPNLIHMVISQYIIKALLALLDTPIFYLLTRDRKG